MLSQAMQCVLAESTETAALEGVAVVLSTITNVYISMNSCSHVVVYATVDTTGRMIILTQSTPHTIIAVVLWSKVQYSLGHLWYSCTSEAHHLSVA